MSRAPAPGTIVARKYRVEGVVGSEGEAWGEGCTVAATHLHLGQRVALKLPAPAGLDGHDAPARFAREARTAAKLRSDHTVQVLDLDQLDDGRPVLVFEYLTGHDLAHEVQARGPLPVEDALRYALETCEALAEAHAARVVHGSLGLRRLFLAERPGKRARVKVLGFGAASADGASCGSARPYRSPEQLTSPMRVDARTDQWGLGATLYELLAGVRPFDGESTAQMLSAVLMGAPPRLREARPELPHGLDDVVARCLRPIAADRFADIAVLAAALAPFAAPSDRTSAGVAARLLEERATAASAPTRPPGAPSVDQDAAVGQGASAAGGSAPGRRSAPPQALASRRPDPREERTPEGLLRAALVESTRPGPRASASGSERPGRGGLTEVHTKSDGPRDPRREAE